MIETAEFGFELKQLGFDFFSGVPCSYLKNLINFAINDCEYVMATNEGDAIAIAAGASLGGKKSVVLMQNSGLTNATSPLISLTHPFQIPILGFVSLRGEPGHKDEPQHELMGQITAEMLTVMNINWEYLSGDVAEAKRQLAHANSYIEANQSFFFIVKKATFAAVELKERSFSQKQNLLHYQKKDDDLLPTRYEALSIINACKNADTIQLATTGKTGRELYDLEDSKHNLYMVGSMGCVSALGLGLALTRPDKAVVAIDGDGALLMRMGNLATNGTYAPENLLHILLDNQSHDSTGGQQTVSANVQFTELAAACGYPNSIYAHNLHELKDAIDNWQKNKQLTFVYLKIAKGSKNDLGRPKMKPYEVKNRLQVFLRD
ncbi:phosphonopyruvate decarboxylase [Bacillus marasmi]|uniref:phosphonopyruvate decarboxylase n=1 Tax=Bacillus marasmi TaxID=1926279 RepID=UPI0011C6F31A|nr:phosphonopyruvate decarboxylase [Bacillus marasmi]